MGMSSQVRENMLRGSWVRRMFEEGILLKERHGDGNVFDLSLGNPVMEPPAGFRRELEKIVGQPQPGMHRYMSNAGYEETRAAVAAQLSRDTGLDFTAGDIVMTCGAAGGLNVVLKTILDPGDEVIVVAPYFVEFLNYIENHGGVARVVQAGGNFLPSLDKLEAVLGPKTKAVILNSPNNPTGVVYDDDLLHGMAGLVQRKEREYGTQVYLLSDEAYCRLIYDGLEFPVLLRHHLRSFIVRSHSKDLALPGERIGFVAVHPNCDDKQDVVDGLVFCNRILGFVNAPALMQNIVGHLQGVTVSIADYERRRDLLYNGLVGMGYSMVKPGGAFYVFPKIPIDDDVAFVRELQEHLVLVVPGSGFGTPGYFRASFCVDDSTIEGSFDGFRKIAQKYGLC
ncbi:MAG: pyridoxal phosphate-dependent aminotransferase [Dehalococcoidales bacterium]|nr:MAG: pyridoxal phosphate-dependent aminotransferase [Dehalococcoidales bacterium]